MNNQHRSKIEQSWSFPCPRCNSIFPTIEAAEHHRKLCYKSVPQIILKGHMKSESSLEIARKKLTASIQPKSKLPSPNPSESSLQIISAISSKPKSKLPLLKPLGTPPPVPYQVTYQVCGLCSKTISGKPREHFLHAKACFLMKQNSPNCLLCPNENFPSKSFYLTHMKSKHGIETNVMLCVCCGVTSNLYENVARHQLKCFKQLKEEADHVCLHCDAHFYHAEPDWENPFFITHMNLKHKDKIELEWDKCQKCQLYIPPGQMESHRDKHCMWNLISNKRKEVTFLPPNFASAAKKPRLILPKKTDISANSLLKKLRCGLCSSTIYGDENILFQHGKICMMKKISSILCPSCPHETFDTKNAYSKHLCDHHKPRSHATKCAFCGITLPTWCDLLKHQNTCFPPLKFEAYSSCQYCDMGFFFEDIRNVFYFAHCNREHKAQIHTKWNWQCNNCGFFFPSSEYLLQHKLICVERTKPGLEQVNEAKLESIESTPDLPMPIPDDDEDLDEHLESEMVFVDEVKAEPIEIEEHSEFITGDI